MAQTNWCERGIRHALGLLRSPKNCVRAVAGDTGAGTAGPQGVWFGWRLTTKFEGAASSTTVLFNVLPV